MTTRTPDLPGAAGSPSDRPRAGGTPHAAARTAAAAHAPAGWDAWATGRDAPTTAPAAVLPASGPPSPRRDADIPGPTAGWPPPPPNRSPRWARGALAVLLAATAVLYLWALDRNGWANAYYSAAAQAGGESWTAWFFGSLDAAGSITVDKPPASLWLMGLSVRLFGLSAWSVLVPQALLGVGSVAVLYAAVRRWFGAAAGLIAGVVLALTPVATLMFRFNNPDALLVFLLVCAAWAMGRATERGSLRWIALAGALVGTAFLAKMMQAFLVLPGFVAMYAVAAPVGWRRRLGHLLAALAALVMSAGWWVAVVQLWPAGSRPYIGGSQTNSIVELILGYNGFGRLTGDETGSVVPGGGAGGPQGGLWGETGWGRLLTASYGGQVAWLLPAALAMIAVLLWASRHGRRTDLTRAAAIGWGGWLLVTAAVISFSAGIIHEYYTVALAPAIGALVGIGSMALWSHRDRAWARVAAAAVTAGSAWWAAALLGRSAQFVPWLAAVVLVGGLTAAALILALPLVPTAPRRVTARAAGLAALVVVLAGPAAYSLQTAATAHSGALPSAGPEVAGMRSGPGGPGGPGGAPGGGQLGAAPGGLGQPGAALGQGGSGQPGGGPGTGQPPGLGAGQLPGQLPGPGAGPLAGGQLPGGSLPGGSVGATPGAGAGGSLLHGSTPGAALTAALQADSDSYTWAAATVGANAAAGYQLATQLPVMAIGGFNGSDPSPTLAEFQQLVAEGRIHYFISDSGMAGPGGGQMSGSRAASEITSWVEQAFTASTIDGTTVYDLSAPAQASGTATPT